ncbi:protein phosphatase 1 regulatory subunit 15A isoform X2 [Sardina pilchardus]|uniref:protein phosphatase 1 regulatory subunit 15A isoform X2 n=1 Tax=Sardina pilchardus TaxID=27697 RepID=UPI002E13EC43
MAPDATHLHALSHPYTLARASSHLSTVKTPAHSGYVLLPVTPEPPTDSPTMVSPMPTPTFPVIRNLQLYLWGALQSVLCHLWAAKELLSCTRVLLFLCSGYLAREAMKGDAEKSVVGRGGAEEEVKKEEEKEQNSAAGLLETLGEEEREVLMRGTMAMEEEEEEEEAEALEESSDEEDEEEEEAEESESDWMEWDSEEEEEIEDEDTLHQQTRPTGFCVGISFSLNSKQASDDEEEAEGEDEENSDWSDDDDDSEASAESVELWESFLHSGDPYNPLSFSCTPVSKNSRNTPASAAIGEQEVEEQEEVEEEQEEREDQQHSTQSTQQKKKVRFSDEVTVRPLVAWAFASKAARNGSCWMEMARDRHRFGRRVEDAGKVISPCLSHDHRRMVWDRRQQQSAL